MRELPYLAPVEGRDFYVLDGVLANPSAVTVRCLARTDWIAGFPQRPVGWPGMRCPDALTADELAALETRVREATGVARLWTLSPPGDVSLDHNHAQLVGAADAGPRPHTDSRALCRFAAVLYLTPDAPTRAGTSFYRQRMPDGTPGGNTCPPPHANLPDALGVSKLPLSAWVEDVSVPNVFNRAVVYRADLVHSATAYFGRAWHERRLTAVFFWMT